MNQRPLASAVSRESMSVRDFLESIRVDFGGASLSPLPGDDLVTDSKLGLLPYLSSALRAGAILSTDQAAIVKLDINTTCARLCDGRVVVDWTKNIGEVTRIATYINSLQ